MFYGGMLNGSYSLLDKVIIALLNYSGLPAEFQEPRVAALAQTYLRCMSFGIPGYAGQIVVKKWVL